MYTRASVFTEPNPALHYALLGVNMKSKYRLALVLISMCIASLQFTACSANGVQQPVPKKTVTIQDVGWVIENIATDYWYSPTSATAFISFWLSFEETDLSASDIASVTVTSPTGLYWVLDDPADTAYFYDEQGHYYGGWIRFWSTSDSANASVIPIGNYTFEVALANGNSDTVTGIIPAPGSTTTGGNSYAYTEDYAGSPPYGYVALPRRATIQSAQVNVLADTFTANFAVTDSKVYNGYLWLYDSTGEYIGMSPWFRNTTSKSVAAFINGGAAIYNDGTANTITLHTADIEFDGIHSLQDISSIRINLSDGAQYAAVNRSYDTLSRSSKYTLP